MGLGSSALATVVLATLAVCVPQAAAQSETRPWAYISPFYQPKSGTSANLNLTNGDDITVAVNIRRYDAVGGLLSSTNVNITAKATVIVFAGANSGAQMHVEAWANSPAVLMEVVFTDAADAVHRIDSGRFRVVGPELAMPAAITGVQDTLTELRPPILALTGQFDTVGGKLDAVQSDVGGLGGKLDAVQSSVSGLGGPVNGVTPQIQVLAAENAALRKDVQRLRRDLRALRKLIVSRLPKRGGRRR